jgi:hypothetical protein
MISPCAYLVLNRLFELDFQEASSFKVRAATSQCQAILENVFFFFFVILSSRRHQLDPFAVHELWTLWREFPFPGTAEQFAEAMQTEQPVWLGWRQT